MYQIVRKTDQPLPVLAAVLLLTLLLGGCGTGGGETALPQSYTVGTEEIPSLTRAVGLVDVTCVISSDEDAGAQTYTYGGVEEAGQMVSDYVEVLSADLSFSVIDAEGVIQAAPDYTTAQGEVTVGKTAPSGAGSIVLELSWQEGGILVTTAQDAGLEITQAVQSMPVGNAITMEEAVALVSGMDPSRLGLSGSAADYEFFVQEGLVDVDGQMCYEVSAYRTADHQLAGSYLITQTGTAVYRLDPRTRQVSPV